MCIIFLQTVPDALNHGQCANNDQAPNAGGAAEGTSYGKSPQGRLLAYC